MSGITVKELRKVLAGPDLGLVIEVLYDGEDYDITSDSPVQRAFDSYVVDEVRATEANQFHVWLKQKYVKEGDHEED